MIHLKSSREIEDIRTSCRLAAEAMAAVQREVRPGVTTGHLDDVADDYIRSQGGTPSAKGYRGFPKSICVSVNEVVVHGIPGDRVLSEGDILSVDIAVKKGGYHGDMNVSFAVGEPTEEARRLLDATSQSMELGMQACVTGNRLGDVGHVIQSFVEGEGYSVVREYCGHGIGRAFHEEPQLLHFGQPQTGRRLEPGIVFTVEPMVNQGIPDVTVLEDNWTAVTGDGKLSAQFEHTIAVTENGPDVLSRFDDLPF
ncbi:MAG: type I methionyl aminopeptidase [Chloroflexi bacterium]|nr:type I methionyl aminopeptidase [Chloroflexota bacterium]